MNHLHLRQGGYDNEKGPIGDATYPLFFYQIPELIPNLVIALGISPPNGVLRRASMWALYWYRVTADVVCCGMSDAGAKLKSAQQSVFDSEFATMSPVARPSFAEGVAGLVAGQQAGAGPHTAVLAPVSSAPIAIPVAGRRTPPPALSSAGSARIKKHEQDGGEAGAVGSPASAIQEEAEGMTVSPVHEHPAVSEQDTTASSIGGRNSSMQTFQLEGPEPPAGDTPRTNRLSKGGNSLMNLVGSVISRSTNSIGGGSSHGRSTHGRRGSRHRGASDMGLSFGDDLDDDEQQWARQRRASAEMAELVYNIQSFSTSDASFAPHTLAASLNSDASGNSSRMPSSAWGGSQNSVDSNTINNSRRHYITDIVGGNRSLPADGATTTTPAKRSYLSSWFSG